MTSRGAEKMNNDTIGVDVSKDHLDAHRLADGATTRGSVPGRGVIFGGIGGGRSADPGVELGWSPRQAV